METWRKISGFDYEVNESGSVRRNGKILKPHIANGYYKYDLYNGSKRTKAYAHRLVLSAFSGDCFFDGAVCNHKDGNRLNNHYTNLEWCTYSQNNAHAYQVLGKKCIRQKGANSVHAKPVKQLTKDGIEVKRYGAISEAISDYGVCIERVLSGRNKTAYGFKWAYAN